MDCSKISAFASTQLSLLDTELQAEVAESSSLVSRSSPAALQRAGYALTNLILTSQRTGLGGKTVVDLEPDPAIGDGTLHEHGIRTGDIVAVQEQTASTAKRKGKDEISRSTGVVTRTKGPCISVALNEGEEDLPPRRLWVYVSRQWSFICGKLIFFQGSRWQMTLHSKGCGSHFRFHLFLFRKLNSRFQDESSHVQTPGSERLRVQSSHTSALRALSAHIRSSSLR
jgi:hypothetical protein